jgi:uncharacterized membrane protein YedE/YeeE
VSAQLKLNLSALFCGALFGVGLIISGMTQPAKVEGFLDFTGAWDASLALVMGGAVTTVFLLRFAIFRLPKPLLTASFPDLATQPVNARLVTGAAIFGIGWGIVGYCPGPALVAVGSGVAPAILFVVAMAVGIRISDWLTSTKGEPIATASVPAPQLSILHGVDG